MSVSDICLLTYVNNIYYCPAQVKIREIIPLGMLTGKIVQLRKLVHQERHSNTAGILLQYSTIHYFLQVCYKPEKKLGTSGESEPPWSLRKSLSSTPNNLTVILFDQCSIRTGLKNSMSSPHFSRKLKVDFNYTSLYLQNRVTTVL